MGDGLKITNEKRHRSSSSLAGVLECRTPSEKKIDIRASIPEVDDQFALAEARCDSLQEKIDLVKILKRKKKLKKRSMTTIAEPISTVENVPMITIRTRPKKKMSQQAARIRSLEVPAMGSNPTRGYIDPDLIEQHQMLDRFQGHKQMNSKSQKSPMVKPNREAENATRPRFDLGKLGLGEHGSISHDMACGDDESSEDKVLDRSSFNYLQDKGNSGKKPGDSRPQSKKKSVNRQRHTPKEASPETGGNVKEPERRQVVELFSKNRHNYEPRYLNINIAGMMNKQKTGDCPYEEETVTGPIENVSKTKVKKLSKGWRGLKYRSRHYEMPTVSSKMKRTGLRCYYDNTNNTNIPFIIGKSTSPSHNVGVNLQQVLNGLKIQQPLSKIPLTIAHHMGLRHIPTIGTNSATTQPTLHSSQINVIELGQKIVRLPSQKSFMSFRRMLSLYRERNDIVSRFLRATTKPHYFYTSMYDLSTNLEDFDAATSKGQGGSHAARQSLIEYANLFREYEQIEKCLNENYDSELEARKDELARKLDEREKVVRKLVADSQLVAGIDAPTLRATASAAEDGCRRHSTYKLHSGGP